MCLVTADRFIWRVKSGRERLKLKWLLLIKFRSGAISARGRWTPPGDSCSCHVCAGYLDIVYCILGRGIPANSQNCLISGGDAGSNFCDVVQTTPRALQDFLLRPPPFGVLNPWPSATFLLQAVTFPSDGKLSTLLLIHLA